ncbi:MAG TPA: NAD-dependent epimerase/dehydratase family protein [Clostridiales bacterium]|nr:NAD-dependent epimerase/dehydratase family protein [Clostridiales bacterium]
MKLLILGGVGVTGGSVTSRALELGYDVTLVNHGRDLSYQKMGAKYLIADFRDVAEMKEKLKGQSFDCVIDFFAFELEEVRKDYELFRGITKQFLFISTCVVYGKPLRCLPVREDAPLYNYRSPYGMNKAACERFLLDKYYEEGFPVTIVRPSHTYWTGEVIVPVATAKTQWTYIDRMLRGKETIVPGDGMSLWTVTHHKDFAKGVVGLIGKPQALGNAFHVTSDWTQTWDTLVKNYGFALGIDPKILHMSGDLLDKYYYKEPNWVVDKGQTIQFDNSKIKSVVPEFQCEIPHSLAARMCIEYYEQHPERKIVDEAYNAQMDRLIENYRKIEACMEDDYGEIPFHPSVTN